MNRRARVTSWLLALPLAAACLPAADQRRIPGNAIELPPMLVEESVSSAPWLYVRVGDTEFLSRCSASTTESLVEAWLEKMQMVRLLVPGEFLAKADVPTVFVLYSQDLQQTVSAEIQRELQAGAERTSPGDPRAQGVNVAPSMRLADRDMHASIAYIDEALFDAAGLSIAPGHVRYLLDGRTPNLPGWLVEGFERTYRRADFILEPITFGPVVWINSGESDAIAGDTNRPRAILPPGELFASEDARAGQNRHPRRAEVRASTQELFVRWALLSGNATREALWKFAARAAEGPVTEEFFESCFGFGYSELRDRLSDYLPRAAREHKRIRPGRLPPLPPIDVQPATPGQIARVRGEWERMAIGHVQRRLPEVREPYIAQARRTLRRAYDAGDRNPPLLATMGLCELEAGDNAAARPFLEEAVAQGVIRPRAYYELARLRFADLQRDAAETTSFSFVKLAPVIETLRRALPQSPPLPESYALLAEAWARCEVSPNTAEFAELEQGGRFFFRRPAVAYEIARALSRHGRKAEAAALLDACAGYTMDDPTRDGIARLRAELTSLAADRPDGNR